jgi:hypothetical protein
MESMNIRPEIPADYPVIRAILLAAFANEPHSRQGGEAGGDGKKVKVESVFSQDMEPEHEA